MSVGPSGIPTERQAVWRFVARAVAFLSACLGVYLGILGIAVNAQLPDWFLTHTNLPILQPSNAQAGAFVEAGSQHDLDILFIGSSHARFTFDPRFFDSLGLRTFNLGSNAQTPVNTEFLLAEYLEALSPRLLVLEAYPSMFGNPPKESAARLAAELPLSTRLVRAVVASRSIVTWSSFLGRALRVRRGPGPDEHFLYRGRGFMAAVPGFRGPRERPRRVIDMLEEQVSALQLILRAQRVRGGRTLLVVQPMPLETRHSFVNYDEVIRRIADIAHAEGAPFVDFNDLVPFDSTMFFDNNHLTEAGAQAFLPIFAAELRRRGLLEAGGAVPAPTPAKPTGRGR